MSRHAIDPEQGMRSKNYHPGRWLAESWQMTSAGDIFHFRFVSVWQGFPQLFLKRCLEHKIRDISSVSFMVGVFLIHLCIHWPSFALLHQLKPNVWGKMSQPGKTKWRNFDSWSSHSSPVYDPLRPSLVYDLCLDEDFYLMSHEKIWFEWWHIWKRADFGDFRRPKSHLFGHPLYMIIDPPLWQPSVIFNRDGNKLLSQGTIRDSLARSCMVLHKFSPLNFLKNIPCLWSMDLGRGWQIINKGCLTKNQQKKIVKLSQNGENWQLTWSIPYLWSMIDVFFYVEAWCHYMED